MIALPRTRGFSAGNWQILLTNNNLNLPTDGCVHGAHVLWGEADSRSFSKADFIRNRIRQRDGGSRRHQVP
jgi:hypothetical protein